MVTKVTKIINGVEYSLETGRLANLAQASILARAGETVILTTISVGVDNPEQDFFPLSVDYIEKLYSAGVISSSRFIKREGRPTDPETISARLLDRGVRSLFPSDLVREVQIITQVLVYDHENSPELLQYLAASTGLLLAGIPFKGPLAIVRAGLIDGQIVYHPSISQMGDSTMDLMVSVANDMVVSIEAEAKMVPENILEKVLGEVFAQAKPFIEMQEEFLSKAEKKEFHYVPRIVPAELKTKMKEALGADFEEMVFIKVKNKRGELIGQKKSEMHGKFNEFFKPTDVDKCFDECINEIVRRNALENKRRIDGRAMDEVRPLSAEVGVLPRVHGSAIFNRGETQVLSIVTLGSARLAQITEGINGEQIKRYMHHYNFPGYSVGEIDRKINMANRRSIGHGMIGEKSLLQVLPSPDDFRYTIRVVSEILSSNGSTSMAATCASTLALMDAGVKITNPIGGISMGLIYDNENKYVLFTDIIGEEDHQGDMDFKITGSRDGWTAIQLDNKLSGIPVKILIEAIEQSKKTRMKILDVMDAAISAPRAELSKYAPRITTIKIDQSRIGELIGPGGKMIKEIIAESGAEVDIDDDGNVSIAAVTAESADKAIMMIKQTLNQIEPGTILDAVIKRVESYGAFIEINRNFGGLVHVSQLGEGFIKNAADVVSVGEHVKVRYDGTDEQGRHNFSMKGLNNDAKQEGEEVKDTKIV